MILDRPFQAKLVINELNNILWLQVRCVGRGEIFTQSSFQFELGCTSKSFFPSFPLIFWDNHSFLNSMYLPNKKESNHDFISWFIYLLNSVGNTIFLPHGFSILNYIEESNRTIRSVFQKSATNCSNKLIKGSIKWQETWLVELILLRCKSTLIRILKKV